MEQHQATNSVNAHPTKEFFISMLTRDISSDRAILDLIDNSIDAANQNNITDANIKISLNDAEFSIYDNAGGIDLETAKTYAFRFGRSSKNPLTPNSVGQFGVGMKRTLFKLGNAFYVESQKNRMAYRVTVDVDSWLIDETNWDFQYEILEAPSTNEGETRIVITKLRDEAKDLFRDTVFLNNLGQEISAAYFKKLHNGLMVELNNQKIKSDDLIIKTSDKLSCLISQIQIDGVTISIRCGISDRVWDDGGWYVVCNDRLVVQADQTETTGWGISGNPKYHADFAYFRGLVDFSCNDSSKLPWTTTKTGVDRDNKIYKAALHHMSLSMKPVLSFLRDLAQETAAHKEGTLKNTPLAEAITLATKVRILEAPTSDEFKRPEKETPPPDAKVAHIQYYVPIDRYEKAKMVLSASSKKEIGEKTFDYFYGYECDDE
jgi:hypothetical protein